MLSRPAPDGFTVIPDRQGTGRILVGSFSGNARSATTTAQGILASLRGYFDNVPVLQTAARTDSDRQVQALFSASIQNVPVVGVIGINLNAGGGTVAVLYDRAGSLHESYARMRGRSTPLHPSPGRMSSVESSLPIFGVSGVFFHGSAFPQLMGRPLITAIVSRLLRMIPAREDIPEEEQLCWITGEAG